MPHYKNLDNEIHFLDEERFEYILPPGCVKITDEEAISINAAKKAAADAAIPVSDKAKAQIASLESTQTPRRIREALLEIADKVGDDCTFLRDLESIIAAERSKL